MGFGGPSDPPGGTHRGDMDTRDCPLCGEEIKVLADHLRNHCEET